MSGAFPKINVAADPSDKRQSEIADFFSKKLDIRRPHERTWYTVAAFFRGNQYVQWTEADNRLTTPEEPAYRVRLALNRIMAKVRSRAAKFLKNRAVPVCVPATMEFKDRLNARASTKAIEYEWRQTRLEQKYRDALDWANKCGHGYWWFHWDPTIIGRTTQADAQGKKIVQEGQIGDIVVEAVSPFEIVVDDPAISYIGDQPRIGRVRLMKLSTLKGAYPKAESISAETRQHEAFMFKDRIGALTTNTLGMGIATSYVDDMSRDNVLVYELYEKPCPEYPKGRYDIMAGGVLLEENQELPHGFSDLGNPYPCVDFTDFPQVGQYWITTIAEQLIAPQREYNLVRSKIAEHLRLLAHPKILVAKQHQLAAGAWTSDSGEIVEYVALPNVPPPTPWSPPPISADVWRSIEMIIAEFDAISMIFPEAEGQVGQSTSGFQTNLLQEATDAVHGPDIRAHELVIEEAAIKLRRMMKVYFDIPRLLTIAGRNLQPEVIEFSSQQVDDFSDIRVEAGSALPTLKAAKIQMISDLWKAGLLGNPQNPEDVRRVRMMLEMGTIEDQYDYDRQDEELARLENAQVEETGQIGKPDAFENHELHYRVHTDVLKSATAKQWQPERRQMMIAHLIMHVRYINPQSAIQLATEYQMPELVQDLMAQMQAAQASAGPQQAPPPPEGAAPQGATQPAPL